ncbi:hypothetical protein KW796_02050 [Candidatus Parcubacteria bacterium]|nr:hypothetical protein [Candidatus Parcubacteria bacterium]
MKKFLTIAFFVLIALYALFQARSLILGPIINIDTPKDGSLADAGAITVSGTGKNISFISLDDRQIYTDTGGRWSEKLIVAQGINIIKVKARDRFGREKEVLVRVVVQ